MISINFTLYRFICDVTTFTSIFSPDLKAGHDATDTPAFSCCWSRVPRVRTTLITKPSGCTSMSYFKTQGSDMLFGFNSTMGSLEIDSNKDVICFEVMTSSNCLGNPVPTLAKGTLDPLPYIGKPSKNYAIKLRAATGQVMGKLLFALEVSEEGGEGADLKMKTVHEGASSSMPYPSGSLVPTHSRMGVEVCDSNYRNHNGSRVQQPASANGEEEVSHPRSSSKRTRKHPIDLSLSQHQIAESAVSPPAPAADLSVADRSPRGLDIDIERVIVKNEEINLSNPAPLLLGGMYSMKVRYIEATLKTERVECQNPKEIVFSHLMSFSDVSSKGEKLHFSLWEDKRQVAGFSLDPIKFCISPGARKEYSIPFRYYPTRQAASLEVTVQHTGVVRREEKSIAGQDCSRQTNNSPQPASLLSHGAVQLNKRDRKDSSQKASHVLEEFSDFTISSPKCSKNGELVGSRYDDPGKEFASSRSGDNSHVPQRGLETFTQLGAQVEQYFQYCRRQEEQQLHGSDDGRKSAASASEARHPSSRDRREGGLIGDEPSYAEHTKREMTCGVNRVQVFLDKIANHNTRSSSVTRRPGRESEVPKVSQSHSNSTECGATVGASTEGSMRVRDGMLLRNHGKVERSSSFGQPRRGSVSDTTSNNECLRNHPPPPPLPSSSPSSSWQRPPKDRPPQERQESSRSAKRNETVNGRGSYSGITTDRAQRADSHSSRFGSLPGFRTSLMDEWLEWRESRASVRASRTGSVSSAFSCEGSVNSIISRNRAASPLPTKSFSHVAELKPYQPVYIRRSSSGCSSSNGRPPPSMR